MTIPSPTQELKQQGYPSPLPKGFLISFPWSGIQHNANTHRPSHRVTASARAPLQCGQPKETLMVEQDDGKQNAVYASAR